MVVEAFVVASVASAASVASTFASAVGPWAIVQRSFQFEQVVAALWGQPRPSPWRLLILASLLYFPTC